MVSSRTGTALYKKNRAIVLGKAKREGLTHCPGYDNHPCGRELNWDQPLLDNSVEADHITPPKYGGTDNTDNLTPLCRACNREKGDGTRTPTRYTPPTAFPTSRQW